MFTTLLLGRLLSISILFFVFASQRVPLNRHLSTSRPFPLPSYPRLNPFRFPSLPRSLIAGIECKQPLASPPRRDHPPAGRRGSVLSTASGHLGGRPTGTPYHSLQNLLL